MPLGRVRRDSALWWVVLTDHQTGGRGRLGRAWTVPDRASLAVSVAVPVADPAQAGLDAAARRARAGRGGARGDGRRRPRASTARLKWPNDVLLADDGDRKLSGILCELVTAGATHAVVVGTGVNVDQTRDELPVDTATSLRLAGRRDSPRGPPDRLPRPARRRAAGAGSGARRRVPATDAGARRRTARRARPSGSQVRVHLPTGAAAEGTAVARRRRRRPRRRTAAGGAQAFAAGDVVHVRPAPGDAGLA